MYSMAEPPDVRFCSGIISHPRSLSIGKCNKSSRPNVRPGRYRARKRLAAPPGKSLLYFTQPGLGVISGDVQLLRSPLRLHEVGPQLVQGLLCVGNCIEEQQVFFRNLLHMVFILSKPPQDVEACTYHTHCSRENLSESVELFRVLKKKKKIQKIFQIFEKIEKNPPG